MKTDEETKPTRPAADVEKNESNSGEHIVQVYDDAPESYDGTCLRPLGLCELGGCCDTCWYRPDHPRHLKG